MHKQVVEFTLAVSVRDAELIQEAVGTNMVTGACVLPRDVSCMLYFKGGAAVTHILHEPQVLRPRWRAASGLMSRAKWRLRRL